MRETELHPEKDGYYRRNIGFVREGEKYRQPKISLGRSKKAAIERLGLIAAIWKRQEAEAEILGRKPFWDALSLSIAKAIGQGQPEYRVSPIHDDPRQYSVFVDAVAALYREIVIRPADEERYRAGKANEGELLQEIELLERDALAHAAEIKAVVLQGQGNAQKYVDLLGDQTLFQAFEAYCAHIKVEKFDTSEGMVNDTGRTKLDMVKQLKTYLADQPLTGLTDFESVNRIFGILRNRPITHRYQKPMARKSASNLIGELGQFFEWLHTSPKWDWRQSQDYHKISRRPLEFDSDCDHETKDIATYSIPQLKTLFEYATPLERLLLLLAINCSYGADQIGRLRIGEVIEKDGVHYIKRVRRKRKVKGIHRLFPVTVDGLRWATKGREADKAAFVVINGKGKSLWRKTKGGNRSADIPNTWYRLLDRVQVDHPEFPRLSFNSVRDTSADMIRRIAGEEVASVHLSHRHQSSDRNLRRYTNAPWKKVFRAQEILERRLREAFTLAEDPWAEREHQYLTQKQIKTMRSKAIEGVSATQIAKAAGVSVATVYRWVGKTIKASSGGPDEPSQTSPD